MEGGAVGHNFERISPRTIPARFGYFGSAVSEETV